MKVRLLFLFNFIVLILINCFLSLFPFTIIAQNNYKIEQLTSLDGLSHDCIRCVFQDSKGFIWIGTEGGLNKYNGYDLTEYRNNPEDPYSISNDWIWCIYEDPADSGKYLWFGTKDGINKFNRASGKFYSYNINSSDSTNTNRNWAHGIYKLNNETYLISGNGLTSFEKKSGIIKNYLNEYPELFVYTIYKDRNNVLWVGTNLGLFWLDSNLQVIELISQKIFPNNLQVLSFYKEKNGKFWIGTDFGLYTFLKNERKLVRSKFKTGNSSDEIIHTIFEDLKGNLLAASNNGLITINQNRDSLKTFRKFLDDLPNPFSRGNNRPYNQNVISALIDNSDIIWIGTCCNGVYKLIPNRKKFKLFRHNPKNNYSLGSNKVTSFCEDKNGNLYVGTVGGNLNKFNKKTEKFLRIDLSVENYSLKEGMNNDIWYSNYYSLINFNFNEMLSTAYFGNGISNTLKFTIHQDNDKNDALRKHLWDSLYTNFNLSKITDYPVIDYLYIEKSGEIWCVLMEDNGKSRGLYTFNVNSKNFYPYKIYTTELISNSITCIYEDQKGILWFGTKGKGLVRRILKEGEYSYIAYMNDKNEINRFKNCTISDITEDKIGCLWIGTDKGLNKFNFKGEIITRYGIKDGLSSELIAGVLADDMGYIWISTNKGLSKFDPQHGKFTNFDIKDGLQSNNFSVGSKYKGKDGEIYFGGTNGFNKFSPENIKENQVSPKVVINGFTLFNKPVVPGENSPINKSIELSSVIVLDYDQDIFTLEFVALDFTDPMKNQYAYKMEGVNDDWIYTDANRRFATYTKLDPGEYTFRVKASNNDGIWNEKGCAINIIILPPWYRTWWANLIYAGLVLSILTYFFLQQRKRLKLKHEIEMKEFEAVKLREVDQMKSKFFANISHEFRTPLTLIKGPVERLISNEKVDDPKKIYRMIKRNSERLLNLINELLDLSKLESGNMKLSAQYADIVSFAKGVAMSFESLALKKKIHISINSDKDIIELYFDKEKLQKILSNIISNAFKFSSQGGKIELNISKDLVEKKVIIKISDNGIGIPEEELPKIFDRFYQVKSSKSDINQGTGIGLALTKELVEMHKGTISVNSVIGEGTSFILSFPLGNEHLKKDEIIYEDVYESSMELYLEDEKTETPKVKKEKPLVLVVEDNIDVQNFIKDAMEKKYLFIKADDGQEGFNKALQFMPDLIVSDIMMPRESGDRMCERLKNNQITSHIPIILLTAKASQEDKISGLETGADDYLIKPFNENELLIRIENLIKQRHKLREKYLREAEIHPREVAVTSIDKKFIDKAINYIEVNIDNENLSIEEFAKNMAMSRSQLYRKFCGVLGVKPSEFVRNYRIKRAAELIKQNFGNIAQIAYEVGFNNLSYFAKSFKKIYKVSPHEYIKSLQKNKSS